MTDIANFPSGLLDECLAREIDLAVATSAAESFLLALGVSCDSESMAASPRRMAEAYAALLTARPFEMTTFPNEERYDELVVVRSIPVQSVCEHHFLPFPDDRVVGLSKLARVVEMFARRPQVQERLTQQIANYLDAHLSPKGVGGVIVAEHSCMTLRGVHVAGTTTSTSALKGILRERPQSRAEFFACLPNGA